MKIAIGADHGGFEMKEFVIELLKELKYEVDDCGCFTKDSVDYPQFSEAVCTKILRDDCQCGILICGTGIGMSLAANRHREIRAALCHDHFTAKMSREHNNANILCLGARVTGIGVATEIVKIWLETEFSGGRHQSRISQYS